MRLYPAFLNLSEKKCLVVGAGKVGMRKIAALLEYGPKEVLVLDPAPLPDAMKALLNKGSVVYSERDFAPEDLTDRFLVFAATNNRELNAEIANLCIERGILCNVADNPRISGFLVPATLSRGDMTIAVSTGAASPALARKIRLDLEDRFDSRYGNFLVLMERVRPLVLGLGGETRKNTAVFRALAGSSMLDAMQTRDPARAHRILEDILPEAIHEKIKELLDGLF
ncbi:MAG: bifunctional precorrin-2 dehydrogenase/sirohydrochlorin ferrochelatase [Thermodesulfobacteriota bacterium]|nr:bifunctional precorrin-2 dehydrogenase/sirohydrochlorin ferrochelatase [Thermodesulfobacteriota bacterium]